MNLLRSHLSALAAVVLFGLMSPASKYALSAGPLDGLALGLERLTWQKCLAGALIAGGVWLVTHAGDRRKDVEDRRPV